MKKLINKVIRPNSTENLLSESGSVLDVFTDTVKKLEALNERITDQTSKKTQEMLNIQHEIASLASTKTKHGKVIERINAILE